MFDSQKHEEDGDETPPPPRFVDVATTDDATQAQTQSAGPSRLLRHEFTLAKDKVGDGETYYHRPNDFLPHTESLNQPDSRVSDSSASSPNPQLPAISNLSPN